jgi:hypothetical protein
VPRIRGVSWAAFLSLGHSPWLSGLALPASGPRARPNRASGSQSRLTRACRYVSGTGREMGISCSRSGYEKRCGAQWAESRLSDWLFVVFWRVTGEEAHAGCLGDRLSLFSRRVYFRPVTSSFLCVRSSALNMIRGVSRLCKERCASFPVDAAAEREGQGAMAS